LAPNRIIAAVALALCFPPVARAADDLNSAARELARRTAAAVGKGDAVTPSWRNLSSLGPAALAQARVAFETALRDAGARASEISPSAEAQLTISENASAGLLVEELRKGEERQVWIASWKRTASAAGAPAVTLDKRLLWEQDEQILDVAALPEGLLVLTPTALIRTTPRQSVAISAAKPWPRDLRGRIRITGATVQVNLPGLLCAGSAATSLTLACKPSEDPWTLESGSRALLLATFAANRNSFDGRVVTQMGLRKSVAPFYSAAAVDDGGRTLWLLAMTDDRTEIFDAAMEPLGNIPSWGSDIAGIDTRCGGASLALATRPGEGPDAIQAYVVANGTAVALGQAVELPGPVTALWPPGVAVVHDAAKGKFQAYAVAVACAP
jgi:hypothetical protein